MLTFVLLLALLAAPSQASSQERTPSPEELWDAYPLDAERTPATAPEEPAKDAVPARRLAATPSPTPARDEAGGLAPLVPIALASLLAFAAGVIVTRTRRPRPPAAAAAPAATEPVAPLRPPEDATAEPGASRIAASKTPRAPQRFERREYAPPARPAPPPPPVPGRSAVAAVAPVAAPWPQSTLDVWRSEIVWQPGEGLKVMVVSPGRSARSTGPLPEIPELTDAVRDLETALEVEGWTPVAPEHMHRFVWPHPAPPPTREGSR